MEKISGKFSKKLRALRIQNHMTQNQLAAILHLSRTTISHYEQGIRCPDIRVLVLIAELFHVSVDYLLFEDRKN